MRKGMGEGTVGLKMQEKGIRAGEKDAGSGMRGEECEEMDKCRSMRGLPWVNYGTENKSMGLRKKTNHAITLWKTSEM